MFEYIIKLYHNTAIGHFLLHPAKVLYDFYFYRVIPEKIFIKRRFKDRFGYDLNLDNPKTLNEKIQWLNLYNRTPLQTLCADKFAVREYVSERIGEDYLVPLLFHTLNPTEITPGYLPDPPFIIKTNHDWRGHIVVRDKSDIDWKNIQKKLKRKLAKNYYFKDKEWQYKNIKPRILVEKLLTSEDGEIPHPIMFQCFHGKVEIVSCLREVDGEEIQNFYDSNWNIIDCEWKRRKGGYNKMPKGFDKMKSIAEELAKDFLIVRVDLYNMDGEIYFGELTFYPFAGFKPFRTPEWDLKLGEMLRLPIEKYES